MLLTDTHLHTSFSSDSEASMESMVKEGIRLGMKTLCFTEHFDYDYPDNPEHLDFVPDFDAYFSTLSGLKEKYSSEIELLCGIELGVQPHIGSALSDFYTKLGNRFDFIINSTHIVDRMDPYDRIYFSRFTPHMGLTRYFETILVNLQTFSEFQSAGHLDYVSRYIPQPRPEFHYKDYQDILDEILRLLIENGKALEINTAGLKAGLSWPNPHMEILKRYRSLGGELITIGSDAHRPEHMAFAFDRLPEIFSEAGFSYYTLYREQKPYFISLES